MKNFHLIIKATNMVVTSLITFGLVGREMRIEHGYWEHYKVVELERCGILI
jgi:hypothetical protein